MSVEQRISRQDSDEVKITRIDPGELVTTNLRLVEKFHLEGVGHPEFYVDVDAECARDDSQGAIHLINPISRESEIREISGDLKPFFMIRHEDGVLGLVEWEHIPGS